MKKEEDDEKDKKEDMGRVWRNFYPLVSIPLLPSSLRGIMEQTAEEEESIINNLGYGP